MLDGKELPQVCVGAEGPEGPGCRVLFHVLPLEAGLTPDILIPPGEQQSWVLQGGDISDFLIWAYRKDFIRLGLSSEAGGLHEPMS